MLAALFFFLARGPRHKCPIFFIKFEFPGERSATRNLCAGRSPLEIPDRTSLVREFKSEVVPDKLKSDSSEPVEE